MQNRLSLAFLVGVERARSLERLALERHNVAANASANIAVELAEDRVSNGFFFVGWPVFPENIFCISLPLW